MFVFLPLVLPLTAWPVARLAAQHLHPRTATRLLTALAAVMATCSTVCLALLMVVGTAQLPGNPLPDGWSDPEVRAAVPYDEVAGRAAVPTLLVVLAACAGTLWRHGRVRRRGHAALAGLPDTEVAVLPDGEPYAYALPGGPRDRVVVTTALLARLEPAERRALFAHERAHLTARHHRYLLTVRLAARANLFLRPCGPRWPTRRSAGRTRRRPRPSAAAAPWPARSAGRRWSPGARRCRPSRAWPRPARCRAGSPRSSPRPR